MPHMPKVSPLTAAVTDHLQQIKDDAERAAGGRIDIRQLILHAAGQTLMTFLEPAEVFDECIVGSAEVNGEIVAAYNKMAVISALAQHRDCTIEQAFDSFTTQWLARPLVDEAGNKLPQTPIFVVDLRDFVA